MLGFQKKQPPARPAFVQLRDSERHPFGLLRDDVCIEGDYRDIVWMAAVNSGNDQENEE